MWKNVEKEPKPTAEGLYIFLYKNYVTLLYISFENEKTWFKHEFWFGSYPVEDEEILDNWIYIDNKYQNVEDFSEIFYLRIPLCPSLKDEIKIFKRTSIPSSRKLYVLKRDNYKCKKCDKSPANTHEVELHIDHINPISKGGSNHIDNLQVLCSFCNFKKHNYF